MAQISSVQQLCEALNAAKYLEKDNFSPFHRSAVQSADGLVTVELSEEALYEVELALPDLDLNVDAIVHQATQMNLFIHLLNKNRYKGRSDWASRECYATIFNKDLKNPIDIKVDADLLAKIGKVFLDKDSSADKFTGKSEQSFCEALSVNYFGGGADGQPVVAAAVPVANLSAKKITAPVPVISSVDAK